MSNFSSARILVLTTCAILTLFPLVVFSQSGRRKDQNNQPRPRPAPVEEPSHPRPVSTEGSGTPSVRQTTTTTSKTSSGEVDEGDVIRVSSNLVPIPASVVDVRGTALTGLRLNDFELWVDGQEKPLSAISQTETPVRMAMLFDNSGSLDFAREFEKRAAIHFFGKVLRPMDEAAIYSVESESYLAQPLTSDVKRLEQTIANFGKPEGSTSLFDAVIDASAYLRPYIGRRVMVIVSDGIETTSRADFDTTIQHVLANDCQIFIVQTGLYDGANLRALAAERRMEELAGQTGGAVFIPKSTADLESAFTEIAANLAQQYVLSYYPGDQPRDGRFHRIELRVKSRKDVRIRTRKGYYSSKPTNVASSGW